jgi:hypothetical protein
MTVSRRARPIDTMALASSQLSVSASSTATKSRAILIADAGKRWR